MKYFITSLVCLSIVSLLRAQAPDSVYSLSYLDKSTRFAEMTLGGDILSQTGGRFTAPDGSSTNINTSFIPRFNIGGIHFWGHADFYVSFPLPVYLTKTPGGFDAMQVLQGVETGAKVYPWAIKPGKLRPYVGISFQPLTYSHKVSGQEYRNGPAEFDRWINPVHLGVTLASKRYLFTLATQYNHRTDFDYYTKTGQTGQVALHPWSFQLGINRYMDTDRGLRSPRATTYLNKRYALLKSRDKLSGWYWALGPTAALQLSKSPYFARYAPELDDQMSNSFLAPDLGAGYYFSGLDANAGIALRRFSARLRAFDHDVKTVRYSAALECYKFIGNYHGFVPFVGPFVSMESLSATVNGRKITQTKPAAGIVFGWDIRVTKVESSLLRTNLRYAPALHLKVDGEKIMFNQLEFNFIQYVRYIGRAKTQPAPR